MVWTLPDRQLPDVVRPPLKTTPPTLYCLHNELHNGANMGELGKVVARHEP